LVSPAGSVGASASQRSPPETRTPRHAPRAVNPTHLHKLKRKRAVKRLFSFLAGAEGFEPSARGFGELRFYVKSGYVEPFLRGFDHHLTTIFVFRG